MAMDRLPVELCTLIFCYACVDNGFTGRSLSLVSRFVNEASKTMKLQSLSVIGYEQLESLASLLEATPETFRLVKYLFISAHCRETASNPRALTPEYTKREKAYLAFERVLSAIGSTVQVLHAYFVFHRPFLLLPVSLPALRELSLHGPCSTQEDVDVWQMVQFPSLRHLQLTSFYSSSHLQSLIRCTPALTHLRVCAPEHSQTFAVELEGLLGGPSAVEGQDASAATAVLPENIEKIFIHCPVEPRDNWMDMQILYRETMSALQRLSKTHSRLVLLSPLQLGLFRTVSIQEAESGWMDSISGRCWWGGESDTGGGESPPSEWVVFSYTEDLDDGS